MSVNDIWYGAPKPVRIALIAIGAGAAVYGAFYAITGYTNPVQYIKDFVGYKFDVDEPDEDKDYKDRDDIVFGKATELNNAGKEFIENNLNDVLVEAFKEKSEEDDISEDLDEENYVITNIFEQYKGPIVNDDGTKTYDYIPRGWDHIPEQDEYVPPEADLPEEEAEDFEDGMVYEDENDVEPIHSYGEEPYPISFQEFDTEHPEYDKMSVVYFAGDGVLADDQNEELDISKTIGEELVYEMMESKNKDFFYARNEKTHTDYEVQKVSITSIERLFGIG